MYQLSIYFLRKYSSPTLVHLSFGFRLNTFLAFLLQLLGNETHSQYVKCPENLRYKSTPDDKKVGQLGTHNHECQPSVFRRIRNLMKTSSRSVPFYVESIMYLDRKQFKQSFEDLFRCSTYLVLGQDYDCKANDDMEVTVRGTIATEECRKFKEMNEYAYTQL